MPRGRRQPLPVRIAGGLLLGIVLWVVGGPLYHPVITAISNSMIRTFERPSVTQLIWHNGEVVVNREDFPPNSPRPSILLPDVTFNVILLSVLFAVSPTPLSDKNVARYFLALLALVPIHVFALISEVESIYSFQLGMWSQVHYGAFARNFWTTAGHFYKIVGVHAVAVVLWLLLSPDPRWWQSETATRQPKAKSSRA